ncbi:IS1380 family transposase, partial [bacterium]|nr:IS1380 family transposase [bacterium]
MLREMDQRLGLIRDVALELDDTRRRASCVHDVETMLRQRVFGLCLGYEDLNDHQTLRDDHALQTVLGKDTVVASPPTLCRFENRADRA